MGIVDGALNERVDAVDSGQQVEGCVTERNDDATASIGAWADQVIADRERQLQARLLACSDCDRELLAEFVMAQRAEAERIREAMANAMRRGHLSMARWLARSLNSGPIARIVAGTDASRAEDINR